MSWCRDVKIQEISKSDGGGGGGGRGVVRVVVSVGEGVCPYNSTK